MVKLVEFALCALITITLWPTPAAAFQDASAASLTVDDLAPEFVVRAWETLPRGDGGSFHRATFEQLPSRTGAGGIVFVYVIVSGRQGVPIESDAEAVLVELADPLGRVAPRELPVGPIGDSARWFRAETSDAPRSFHFAVVFRVGDHLASVKVVRYSEARTLIELVDYATLVAERLRAL